MRRARRREKHVYQRHSVRPTEVRGCNFKSHLFANVLTSGFRQDDSASSETCYINFLQTRF